MTENHSYDEPTLGSTSGWGSQLNSNFRDLDTDVEIRDTDANKGNYTPKNGALYRATDTGAIYQGDGTSWVLADMEVNSLTTETLSNSRRFVSPGEDLSSVLSNEGAGKYILEPASSDYQLDEVPDGVYIEGASVSEVTVATSGPSTVNLSFADSGAIGDVTLKTASSPGSLSAGDPRPIKSVITVETGGISPVWWPRGLSVLTGGSDQTGTQDRPAISGFATEAGDGLYGKSREGWTINAAKDSSSNGGKYYVANDEGSGPVWEVDYSGVNGRQTATAHGLFDSGTARTIIDQSNGALRLGFDWVQNATNGGDMTAFVDQGGQFQVYDIDSSLTTFVTRDGWVGHHARTTDPPAPGSGVRKYYRSDLSPPELRAIDENGTITTIAQF